MQMNDLGLTTASVSIQGTTPMNQSRKHDMPYLEGEKGHHDEYDERTWRFKLNTKGTGDEQTVVVPQVAFMRAVQEAAKYAKKKIEGQGNSTWTAKFRSGIAVLSGGELGIHPSEIQPHVLSLNADGVRGSGKRVTRRMPEIPAGWVTTFQLVIYDPIITRDIFLEMVNKAGLFIGVGQFRPENGGTNGRFIVTEIEWNDAREEVIDTVAQARAVSRRQAA